jgi:hypothetical protein
MVVGSGCTGEASVEQLDAADAADVASDTGGVTNDGDIGEETGVNGSDGGQDGASDDADATAPWVVEAGDDASTMLPEAVMLMGRVDTPGAPDADIVWELVDGPAPVVFEEASAPQTQATFFMPGDYTLRLVASDGQREVEDSLAIEVTAQRDDDTAMLADDAPRQLHATIHSVGVEWDIDGDPDHDAYGYIRYREPGRRAWQSSMPLVRIDYDFPAHLVGADRPSDEPLVWNMLAGSLLFLKAGTTYEVEILLADPDGGFAQHSAEVETRAVPEVSSGPTLHVIPGDGGGSGTEEDPFRGIDAADEAAQPGDVFALAPGEYGRARIDSGGMPGQPVVWRGAEDGVVLDRLRIGGSHSWFFDLDIVNQPGDENPGVRPVRDDLTNVVIRRSRIDGFHYGISIGKDGRDWTVMDNVIVGDNDPDVSEFSGEGVELAHTSGHVVAYNRISRTGDGVSYMRRNCDVYGNDIFATSDDGIEPDYGLANNRIWGNRIRDIHNNGLSFQPQRVGPWYFLYNQVVISGLWILKFNGVVDRAVLINNTFVNLNRRISERDDTLTAFITRNNLFVSDTDTVLSAREYDETPNLPDSTFYAVDWRTDLDYDGFGWKAGSQEPFVWFGTTYSDLDAWASALGVEPNGVSIDIATDLGALDRDVLTLPDGSRAIDAGQQLPNVHDGRFAGQAPDLGAHEQGTQPQYGPR